MACLLCVVLAAAARMKTNQKQKLNAFLFSVLLYGPSCGKKNVRSQPIALQVCPTPISTGTFFPATITIEEMTAFSLFALKAVLSGRTRGGRPLHHATLRCRRSKWLSACP